MPLYSLKVPTLVARWKPFRSSSSAIFVGSAVPQWLLYCVCGHKKRFDQLFGFCGQKGQLQLKFITGDETWVHQYYPETQAQPMAWKHPWFPTIKKFKTSTSSGKLMATVFWDMRGVLLLHFSPPNETVNSAAYQATPKKLKRAVQRKKPQMSDKRLLLLHDNARPHTAHATVNLLERWDWEILEQPAVQPRSGTFGLSSLHQHEKTSSCQAIQIT